MSPVNATITALVVAMSGLTLCHVAPLTPFGSSLVHLGSVGIAIGILASAFFR